MSTKEPVTTVMRPQFWTNLQDEARIRKVTRSEILDEILEKRYGAPDTKPTVTKRKPKKK